MREALTAPPSSVYLNYMLPYYNYFIMFIGPYGHMTIKSQWGKVWGPLVVRFRTTCCRIIITSVCSLVHVVTCRPSWIACSFSKSGGESTFPVRLADHCPDQQTHVVSVDRADPSWHSAALQNNMSSTFKTPVLHIHTYKATNMTQNYLEIRHWIFANPSSNPLASKKKKFTMRAKWYTHAQTTALGLRTPLQEENVVPRVGLLVKGAITTF